MAYGLSGAVILPAPKNPWSGGNAPGGINTNPVPFIAKKKPAAPKLPVLKPPTQRPPNPALDAFKPVKPTVMPVIKPLPPSGDTGTLPISIMPAVPPIQLPVSGGGGGGGGASSGGGGGSGGEGGDYNEASLFPTGGLDSLKNLNPLVLIGGAVALYFLTRKR